MNINKIFTNYRSVLASKKDGNDGRSEHANTENVRQKQNIKIQNHVLKSFLQLFLASIN